GRQIIHAHGIRVRPGWCRALQRVGEKAPARSKWLIVAIAVAAGEEYHVARAKPAVLSLPGHDALFCDEVATTCGTRVEEVPAIDDTGLADELPGRHHVSRDLAERTSVGKTRTGRRDRMSGCVELGPRVFVDGEDVAIVGAERADALVVVDLKRRPAGGPGTGQLGRNEKGQVHELGWCVCFGLG